MSSRHQEQVIAIAGMFQAVALVDQLATSGQVDSKAFNGSISSVLEQNPDNTLGVYGELANLELGLKKISDMLSTQRQSSELQLIRYALGLLHLQKHMSKTPALQSIIGDRIEQAIKQGEHFGNKVHENVIANLAGIYQDTFSKLNFRIQVSGDPSFLQQTHIANQIRALLLAGIRAATLWRQVGGNRWQLFFQRKKLLKEAEQLLKSIHS